MCSTGWFALTCRLQLVAHGATTSIPQEVLSPFAKGVGRQQQQQQECLESFSFPGPQYKPEESLSLLVLFLLAPSLNLDNIPSQGTSTSLFFKEHS